MSMHSRFYILPTALLGLLLLGSGESLFAQVRQPLVSPYATVSEEVGLTDITIKYARPAVRGREIWGALVPYGFAEALPNFGNGNDFPWRAGANRTTTISFEHDVLIEGQKLAAGKYGLHMIPGEQDWVVIFNNEPNKWGSFFYDETQDALRVTVTPEEAPFKERLTYEFVEQDDQGGLTVALRWAEKKVPFRVEVDDYHSVVLAEMEDELFHRGGFTWQNFAALANYTLANNTDLEKGKVWAERAITFNNSFATQSLMGRFMYLEGREEEADAFMEPLIEASTENELNLYGYQLMGMGMMDGALEIFQRNIERHPDAWNPHDSLGECYANMGDTANAIKYYGMALEKLPEGDEANRSRIQRTLARLEGGGDSR